MIALKERARAESAEADLAKIATAMKAYPDSDLISLATTLQANAERLDSAVTPSSQWDSRR